MIRNLSILILINGITMCTLAQSQSITKRMIDELSVVGFENIRIVFMGDKVVASIENNIFRWDVDAIRTAIDILIQNSPNLSQLSLIFLRNDIPVYQIKVSTEFWLNKRDVIIDYQKDTEGLLIQYETDDDWILLKNTSVFNSNANKIDVVIYPQLKITNILTTQLYEIQFNIAPAVEISLWKGMLFTGQIIFPLKNDFEVLYIKDNYEQGFLYATNEGDLIRPGFITISQDIKLPKRWIANITVGNFNEHRYGINFLGKHYLNDRINLSGCIGFTGSSHFYDGRWISKRIDNCTWQAKLQYYYSKYNLNFDISYGNYISNDNGFRIDCIRHFKETTVGFFVMHTGGISNGGFNFTIPLQSYKRNRNRSIRLKFPEYYDSEYNAGYAIYYGLNYETKPDENKTEYFDNLLFIKKNIINGNQKY